MFNQTAKWYDALYSFKDYKKETEKVTSIIRQHHPNAKYLLDVACGTGEHSKYLSYEYNVDGIDISDEFIEIASRKNPNGKYTKANMADFNLHKMYDIVLCLFSSIGYVKTVEDMNNAIRCFSNHLQENGVIIIEPWFTKESWNPSGNVYMVTGETEEGKICRMNISERKGSLSILNFNYLVGTREGIKYFTERHELGLFSIEEMKEGFEKAGLNVDYSEGGPSGRGIYIARKR